MGRVLALDLGERRIGLALSDPMHIIASPFKIIDKQKVSNYILEIKKIIDDNDVDLLVVGLPITLFNKNSIQTKKVIEEIEKLKKELKIKIHTIDERLSSISAKNILVQKNVKTGHNKGEIDKVAASIFLQEYLDSK